MMNRRACNRLLFSLGAAGSVGTAAEGRSAAQAADPALQAPDILLSPRAAEYQSRARIFQGIPGIERSPQGRLWAIWYAGSKLRPDGKVPENAGGGMWEGPFNFVVVVTSGDDGRTWSNPKVVIDPPGLTRAFDPCLWLDPTGKLWLFWAQSGGGQWDGRGGVWAVTTDQPDSETPEWSAPRRIANGVMMNKPTVLTTGEWLFPIAGWLLAPNTARYNEQLGLGLSPAQVVAFDHDLGSEKGANVFVTRDQGKTFSMLGQAEVPPQDWSFSEHMIVERQDRGLWMLVRMKYGIGESVSSDRGRSWTRVRDTLIPHTSSRFFIRRLNSGNLLMVRHNSGGKLVRSHLTAFVSEDDGRSWPGGLLLDERLGVSYPDGFQAENGLIYIIYDRDRTKDREILFATFTEADVKQGESASAGARLKMLVNRASDG